MSIAITKSRARCKNKGILIVHVKFNAESWEWILDELQLLFGTIMVSELLTGKILCEIRA